MFTYTLLNASTLLRSDNVCIPVDPENADYKEYLAYVALGNTASTVTVSSNESVLKSIFDLEATITPRRLRDSILGTDSGWLESIEAQISALRTKLV